MKSLLQWEEKEALCPEFARRRGKMFSKEEIERIKRDTSFPALAASYGYAMDEKASCRTSLVMRHHGNKIIVATGEDGHGIFFDVHGSASGSVIDFVMWQEGVNFGKACQILGERITAPQNSFPTVSKLDFVQFQLTNRRPKRTAQE